MIGASLNQYRITATLGAGGMGEVFRARDTRLNRDVAVKVLPKDFAGDADRLWRFEQEAKTLATLNHPNVLTIHDAGIHEGAPYLVSELLEGQTLREVLGSTATTALPVRKATEYALQIAHGLAAAHGKAVIHRDLKPENIFVTRDGRVKILDFGLAKLRENRKSEIRNQKSPLEADAPTLVQSMAKESTEPGLVLGTPAYMSPEQVRGERADHRADLFAFGCVLYEMLSGTRAFRRDTPVETMTAILNGEPTELAELNPKVALPLDRIVRRCLEKQPDRRFQSASDLAFALESQAGSTTSVPPKPIAGTFKAFPRSLWPQLGFVSLVLLVLGMAGGLRLARRAPETSATSYRQLTFRRGTVFHARFAPDGRSIYYSAKWGQDPLTLFAAQEGRRAPTSLALTNADILAVSRAGDLAVLTDIRRLSWFVNQGTLARMTPGDAPRPLLENVTEADWSPDGTSLVVVHIADGMWRLEEFPSRKILYQTTGYLTYPRVSPAGDHVAFMAHQLRFDNRGWVVILDRAGKTNAISQEWTFEEGLSWTPSGQAVWFSASRSGDLVDLHALEVSGRQRRIASLPASLVIQDTDVQGRVLALRQSSNTEIIEGRAAERTERNISWLGSGNWSFNAAAADGKSYLAGFGGEGSSADYLTYLCKTDGSPALQLGEGNPMAISLDGRWALVLLYSPSRLVLLPTGAGQLRTIQTPGIEPKWAYFHPDGKRILYTGSEVRGPIRFFIQEMDGASPRPVTPGGIDLQFSIANTISPRGDRFIGTDTNQTSLLCFIDGSAPKIIPNMTSQDLFLGWHADGQLVFVARRDQWPYNIYKLDVTTGRKDEKPMLQLSLPDRAGVLDYPLTFVTPDGQSYLYSFQRFYSDVFVVGGLK